MAAGTWMHDSAIMTLPKEIRFQIKDATNDLTHFAHAAEFLFEGDPAPLGDDDGQLAVVVDMSPDGTRPVGVRSLTSSLMVSGFEWKPEAADGDPAAALMVDGVSLQKRAEAADSAVQASESAPQQLFANIQRDAEQLAKRVSLVKQALDNADSARLDASTLQKQ